jgi:hypothetical protein
MARKTRHVLLLILCAAACCAAFLAQSGQAQALKTIKIKILDARTARPFTPSNFLVRINHQETVHADWVRINDDGSAKLTVPEDAVDVSIQATYDSATEFYVNCDSAREKRNPVQHWYAVSTILAEGIVAPNGCGKMTETPHPGEFVFFARKENWREQMRDYSPQ